jgi:hypothetical protein
MTLDRFGLLVRCNPSKWDWRTEVAQDGSESSVMWTCRLKQGSIPEQTPVWVLGTNGSGFFCTGYTLGDIHETDGSRDNNWKPGHKHRGGRAPRIELMLRMTLVSEDILRASPYDYLINRQNTFSWLTEEEAFFLEDNVG